MRQDNNLVARTKSGTIYYLELAEMFLMDDFIKGTKAALKDFGLDEGIISEAGVLSERKSVEYLKMADKLIGNNELLLIMKGASTTKAYFKSDNKVEMCNADVHIGTFQDSILVRLLGKVDFRYFPHSGSCEVYHWSDGLLGVKIHNAGTGHVVFSNQGKSLLIRRGQTQSLNRNIFANEGLFSPDCVNGKSVLG